MLQRVSTARIAVVVVAALLGMAAATFPASAASFTISGTVRDASSAVGIAGAQITTQPATTSTTTDASGNYSILVAPGTYSVVATAAGYNSNFASVTVNSSVTANLALTAVPAQSAQDLFTRPNQSGFGSATDGHSWSTDNASANVAVTNSALSFQTSGTSVDGWMGIPYQDQVVSADINIASGTARVLARVAGAGTWVALVVDPGNDDLLLYSVTNNQWSQIGFWAAAPNLAFNTSYHVRLEAVGNVVAAKEWLFTDPEPAWDVTANQSTVTGSGVGGLGSAGASSTVSRFTEAPVTQVAGKVSDSNSGQPVVGATVTAGGSSATTDTAGAYTIGGLAAGTYTVSASAPNYTPGTSSPFTVSTGVSATANLSLQYSPTTPPPPTGNSTIAGTVTDAATSAPISGALVTVPGNGGGSVTANSAGQYTMSINAGTYNVVVTASGYNSNFASATTAVGSPATANVALTAVPPQVAEDLFTRPNQSGIGTASDGHVWTDDHATYNLGTEQIAGNELVVQTASRSTDYDAWMGYPYQDQQVSADFDCVNGLGARLLARVQGEETWIALVMGGTGSIVLWAAQNGNWTFLASAQVTVSGNTWYHSKLATLGNKVYGKVWPAGSPEPGWQAIGTQTIVNGAGYGGIRTAGADTNYQNFLEAPLTQISGQVTNSTTGNPISGATVSVPGGPSATTDVNGLYALSGLAAGTYSVTAAATGYNSSTQPATVGTAASTSLNFSLTSSSGGNQTNIVQDTFSRANQSGWGTASNGMSWSSGTGLSISGDEGTVSNSSSSQFETLGTATTSDGNGLVRFSVAATNDTAGILMRSANGAGLLARYDGAGNVQLMTKSGGGGWTGVAKAPVTVSSGSFYWLRFLVQGTAVSMKLWPSGAQEPSAWTWTGSNTAVSGAGTMGLYAWAAASRPVSFDNFSVASLAPPPPALSASLKVTPASGAAPLQVTADASASTAGANPISTYAFNFGDGTTVGPQAGATATHTYTTNGTYTVTVTVTDSSGATSTASATATVQAGAPPKAALTVTPTSGVAPLQVTADASASTPGANPISTYTFNFGDGTIVGPQAGATSTHTYTTNGTYTITVTVTDTSGATSTASATATVQPASPPKAALTVTPASGVAPLQVTADASASTAGTNPISTYSFNFGDGTTVGPQAAATATHTYSANGSFTVTVTVTDTSGATSTASAAATVQASPPKAALTVLPSSGTAPLAVTADASASTAGTNPIASYNFNFGDGTSTGAQGTATAPHTYTTGGTFTVTVTVTATDGSTATATAGVTVTSSTVAQDSFQRANQTGWGTASNGMTWSAGSGASIAGNEGLISNSSSSQYEQLGSVTCTDGNGLVRFSVAAANDTAGIILRSQTNGNMTLARYDGAGNLEFMVRSGGTWTIVSKTPVSVSTNTFYWLRFLAQGTSVSLKLWKSGTTEPAAFTWTGTSTTITTAGQVGLYGWASSGAPVSFDSFSVS